MYNYGELPAACRTMTGYRGGRWCGVPYFSRHYGKRTSDLVKGLTKDSWGTASSFPVSIWRGHSQAPGMCVVKGHLQISLSLLLAMADEFSDCA